MTVVKFNLHEKDVSNLEKMAAEAGITMSEVIRHGIGLMGLYMSHVKKGDSLIFCQLDRYDMIKENRDGFKLEDFGFEYRLRKR